MFLGDRSEKLQQPFGALCGFLATASAEFCQVRLNGTWKGSAVLRRLRRLTSVQCGLAIALLVKRRCQFRADGLPLALSILGFAEIIRPRFEGAFNVRGIP